MKVETLLKQYSASKNYAAYNSFDETFKKITDDANEFKNAIKNECGVESFKVDRILKCVKDIKNEIYAKEGKKIDLKLDSKIGRVNLYKKALHNQAVELFLEKARDSYVKEQIMKHYAPKSDNIPGSNFIKKMAKTPQELKRIIDYSKRNPSDIDPFTGKTYGELKKDFFVNSIDRCKDMVNNLSSYRKDEEFLYYAKKDYEAISALSDLDGNKIEDVANYLGVELTDEMKKDFKPYSLAASVVSNQQVRLGLMANPYFDKLTPEDADIISKLLMTKGMEFNKEIEDVNELNALNEKDSEKLNNLQMYGDLAKAMGYQKSDDLMDELGVEGVKKGSVQAAYTGASIKYMLAKDYPDLDVNSIRYYDSKNKRVDEKDVCLKAIKGEKITLIDKDDNFLMDFKTDNQAAGLNNDEETKANKIDIKDQLKNEVLNANKNLSKKDFDALSKNLTEAEIRKGLKELKNILKENSSPFSRMLKKSGYNDVIKDIDNLLKKESLGDKETLAKDLKSIKDKASGIIVSQIKSGKKQLSPKQTNALKKVSNTLKEMDHELKAVEEFKGTLSIDKNANVDKKNLEQAIERDKNIYRKPLAIDKSLLEVATVSKKYDYHKAPVSKQEERTINDPNMQGPVLKRKRPNDDDYRG